MFLFKRSRSPEFKRLRMRAAGAAAGISLLGFVAAAAFARRHFVLGGAAIAAQVALLTLIMRFLFQALRLARGLKP